LEPILRGNLLCGLSHSTLDSEAVRMDDSARTGVPTCCDVSGYLPKCFERIFAGRRRSCRDSVSRLASRVRSRGAKRQASGGRLNMGNLGMAVSSLARELAMRNAAF
jgi:hypothetical protein